MSSPIDGEAPGLSEEPFEGWWASRYSTRSSKGSAALLAATLGNVTVQLAERPYQIQVTEDHPDVVALFTELRIDGDVARRQALQWIDQEIFAPSQVGGRCGQSGRGARARAGRRGPADSRRTAEAVLEGQGSLGVVGRDSPHLVSVADRLIRGGILRSGAWRSARDPGQQAGVVGEALATEQFRRTAAPGRRVMVPRMLVRGDAYQNPTGPELAQMSDGTPMRRATLAEADLAEIETTPEGRHVVHRLGSVKAGSPALRKPGRPAGRFGMPWLHSVLAGGFRSNGRMDRRSTAT